jgi:hypothetical protein
VQYPLWRVYVRSCDAGSDLQPWKPTWEQTPTCLIIIENVQKNSVNSNTVLNDNKQTCRLHPTYVAVYSLSPLHSPPSHVTIWIPRSLQHKHPHNSYPLPRYRHDALFGSQLREYPMAARAHMWLDTVSDMPLFCITPSHPIHFLHVPSPPRSAWPGAMEQDCT